MRWILGLTLGFAALTSANAAEPQLFGHAETRYGGSPELVAAVIIEEMRERQYFLVDESSGTLRFARPIDNFALREKLGNLDGPLPQARIVFTLVPDGKNTRIASELLIVTNPGRPEEKLADASTLGADPNMQAVLDGLPQAVSAYAARSGGGIAMANR